jgi:hypothetical protein
MLLNHAPLIVAEQFGTLEFDPLCRSIASTGALHKPQHSVPTMAVLPNESPEQLARGQRATIQPMQS